MPGGFQEKAIAVGGGLPAGPEAGWEELKPELSRWHTTNKEPQGEKMSIVINPMTAATQALTALSGAGAGTSATSAGAGAAATPFSDLMTDAIGQVNQLDNQARSAVEGLMSGSGVDVHQAMIATQKASMAFELALAVRNKAVQAYQQVVGMQF
jgi:flagellar hook-basal body complex protein FliE